MREQDLRDLLSRFEVTKRQIGIGFHKLRVLPMVLVPQADIHMAPGQAAAQDITEHRLREIQRPG